MPVGAPQAIKPQADRELELGNPPKTSPAAAAAMSKSNDSHGAQMARANVLEQLTRDTHMAIEVMNYHSDLTFRFVEEGFEGKGGRKEGKKKCAILRLARARHFAFPSGVNANAHARMQFRSTRTFDRFFLSNSPPGLFVFVLEQTNTRVIKLHAPGDQMSKASCTRPWTPCAKVMNEKTIQ